ncbi:nucleotide sugar dehydrogenase [Selenomonas sp. AB3002]|uniref:nucleotide sugar dehydrogenase n=1 Tax=Selenomonas sp. AB3002 TaxID=1392502 RepID=UPI000496E3BD
MKITVAGAGYVGMANALVLAQHHEVSVLDISAERVAMIRQGKSPVRDEGMERWLSEGLVKISAFSEASTALCGAELVLIATPTDYDAEKNFFDTSSIECVIDEVLEFAPGVDILIRSTVPVGYTLRLRERYGRENIYFAPEFLREGHALHDSLHPSRIILGDKGEAGRRLSGLFLEAAESDEVPVLLMGPTEAEAVKLFANTYLALRVAYFNELDSYAAIRNLSTEEIIRGVCMDPRIGDHYNNPSFGYGGYCLPKDSKQLLANYEDVPQNLITAIVQANRTRKDFIVGEIIKWKPKTVGVYRLTMKKNSDNFRSSAVLDVIEKLQEYGVECLIYEPTIGEPKFRGCSIVNDLVLFKRLSDILIANRWHKDLEDERDKVYTCDVFGRD